MSVFTLKIIAIISMILDHIKYAIPSTKCFSTEYLGRISFPIFAFLISEGFVHTRSKSKYMIRILAFAVISQIPFYLFAKNLVHSRVNFNVMFTFEIALLGLCIIDFFKNYKELPKIFSYIIATISLILILILTYYIHPDYSWYGVVMVWGFYIFRNNKILNAFMFVILNFIYYLSLGLKFRLNRNYLIFIFSLVPLIFILLYNGKQGRKVKYFFYVFYPLQFLILYGINYFFIK